MGHSVPDHVRITDKQRVFCDEYMVDRNISRAARAAGYAVPSVAGNKLLDAKRYPLVAAYLSLLKSKQDAERTLRKKFLAEQLHRMVSRDVIGFERNRVVVDALEDVPRDLRMCVDGFKVKQYMDPETGAVASQVIEVKLSPLASAVDMALKVRGMYAKDNEQKPSGSDVTVVNWGQLYTTTESDDPIERRIAEEDTGNGRATGPE